MRRIDRCSRCGELYRRVRDDAASRVCPVCRELDRIATDSARARTRRRRMVAGGCAAILVLAGGIAGVLALRSQDADRIAQTGVSRSNGAAPSPSRVESPGDDFAKAGPVRESGRSIEVHVASEPPGADVWIDGEPCGRTPLSTTVKSAAGDATDPARALVAMRLFKEGYEPVDKAIPLPFDGTPLQWKASLQPAAPRLRIESEPPGATVWLGEQSASDAVRLTMDDTGRDAQSRAPITIALNPRDRGRRLWVFGELDGFAGVRNEVGIADTPGPDQVVRLKFAMPATHLSIDTDPPGGQVRLNGRAIGVAPVRAALSEADLAGPIVVEAMADGAHFGRRELPPPVPGADRAITLELAFFAHRVVFAVSAAAAAGPRLPALRERLKDEIESLTPGQQFCVVAETGEELRFSSDGLAPATSEQKVRAYDFVDRLGQAAAARDSRRLAEAVKNLDPDVAWVCGFRTGDWTSAPGERHRVVRTLDQTAEGQVAGPAWLADSSEPDR